MQAIQHGFKMLERTYKGNYFCFAVNGYTEHHRCEKSTHCLFIWATFLLYSLNGLRMSAHHQKQIFESGLTFACGYIVLFLEVQVWGRKPDKQPYFAFINNTEY